MLVVKAAAQKALFANLRGTLRSRSMHAELVFSVAGSKHVSSSLPLLSDQHFTSAWPCTSGYCSHPFAELLEIAKHTFWRRWASP